MNINYVICCSSFKCKLICCIIAMYFNPHEFNFEKINYYFYLLCHFFNLVFKVTWNIFETVTVKLNPVRMIFLRIFFIKNEILILIYCDEIIHCLTWNCVWIVIAFNIKICLIKSYNHHIVYCLIEYNSHCRN